MKTYLFIFLLSFQILSQTNDTIAPVILLKGNNLMNVSKNCVFVDPGAVAVDNVDGNISSKIIITGTVNTAIASAYVLCYNVSDNAGNAAITKTRIINVTNSTAVMTKLAQHAHNIGAKTRFNLRGQIISSQEFARNFYEIKN